MSAGLSLCQGATQSQCISIFLSVIQSLCLSVSAYFFFRCNTIRFGLIVFVQSVLNICLSCLVQSLIHPASSSSFVCVHPVIFCLYLWIFSVLSCSAQSSPLLSCVLSYPALSFLVLSLSCHVVSCNFLFCSCSVLPFIVPPCCFHSVLFWWVCWSCAAALHLLAGVKL